MNFSMWNLLAIVLAIGTGFLFYHLVKLLIQVKDTIKSLETTLSKIENDVSLVLNNVEGITGNFEQITGRADSLIQNVQTKAMDSMKVVEDFKKTPDILKHSIYIALGYIYEYLNKIKRIFKISSKDFKENNTSDILLTDSKFKEQNESNIVDHIETRY